MRKWFKDVTTIGELRKRYRGLYKKSSVYSPLPKKLFSIAREIGDNDFMVEILLSESPSSAYYALGRATILLDTGR